jgi:hypothetical protein
MKFPSITRRIIMLLAASALLLGLPAAAAAAAAAPLPAGTGWIRMAHLSPNTPPVDVYLYSFGDASAQIVLHHVSYGTVSPYEAVAAGDYAIAMRPAGTAANSQPVLSASVTVAAGHAYTVAAVGPRSGLRLQVMDDDLTTPSGKALLRVIQASLTQQAVKVSWDGKVIVSKLAFAAVTSYQAVTPGTESVTVTGTGKGTGGDASSKVTLAAGTVHTLVVLDGSHGLEIANLEDAAGSAQLPVGGAQTGLGGTAPHRPGSPLPWLALIGAGALLALASGMRLRQW